jgi:hypothetical protein
VVKKFYSIYKTVKLFKVAGDPEIQYITVP